MRKTILAVTAAILVVSGGTATAAKLLTGGDIRNGSLTGADVKKESIPMGDLSKGTQALIRRGAAVTATSNSSNPGARGANGANGAKGADGQNGQNGQNGATGATGAKGDAGPFMTTLGHLIHIENGGDGLTSLTYRLKQPVAIKDIDVTAFQEKVHGDGNYGASMVLGVDTDADGTYEANDEAWHFDRKGSSLNGDTFVEMSDPRIDITKMSTQGTVGWYSPDKGDGAADNPTNGCISTTQTLPDYVKNCPDHRLKADGSDKVRVVKFVLGGAPSWDDIAVRITVPGADSTPEVEEYVAE